MAGGDILLRDPRVLRALAHPVRIAILDRLVNEAAATASEIGAAEGISASAASYHLRALARFGLVEDAGGGVGRNRPWRATGTGFAFEPAHDPRPAAQAAAHALGAQIVERGNRQTLEFMEGESRLDRVWRDASHIANATLRLTPEEAVDLVRAIDELLEPYLLNKRGTPPPDAIPVRFLWRLFPRDLPAP